MKVIVYLYMTEMVGQIESCMDMDNCCHALSVFVFPIDFLLSYLPRWSFDNLVTNQQHKLKRNANNIKNDCKCIQFS